MYQIEVRHDGLHKYRLIKGLDPYVVNQKAQAQKEAWDEMWARQVEREGRKQEREARKEEAERLTLEAEQQVQELEGVLAHTLGVDDAVEWDSLKDRSVFPVPRPAARPPARVPPEPRPSDSAYRERWSTLDRIVNAFTTSRGKRLAAEARARFDRAHAAWEGDTHVLREDERRMQVAYRQSLEEWERQREAHRVQQAAANAAIDRQRAAYEASDPEAVTEYCDLVLSRSAYPSYFPQEYEVQYLAPSRTLVVEYVLPTPEMMPTLKEVRYVQTRDELVEASLTEKVRTKLYDQVIYQVALRTLHELFEADVVGALEAVVFNGWVSSIDETTGKAVRPCILSVRAGREAFLSINLAQVEPRACFKSLKGVASAALHAMAAIPPIMNVSREDSRFVAAKDVVAALDPTSNLATMPWEDFEHLVREIFGKEFSSNGGEVKVTRASRDGGVDAVAFDPDPIRGGKIIIQAKRYTRTVGVSAIRDLYGTVMNEGAIKGILVTTADYGPDAYKFALGKPLTLMNGSNLLHLLEKHGHSLRIDLREARADMNSESESD